MDNKRKALGKGIGALLGENSFDSMQIESGNDSNYQIMPINKIIPNPDQPRKIFNEAELDELASSIQSKGVLQPILVRKSPNNEGFYEIISGERRWRASQKVNLTEIPVVIKELSNQELYEVALIENLQRESLNSLEEAEAYDYLMNQYHLTQEEVAKAIGKNRSTVANSLRLLTLPSAIKDKLRLNLITAGHARALVGLDNIDSLVSEIVEKGLSVREVEKKAASLKKELDALLTSESSSTEEDVDLASLEQDLSAILSMPVKIKCGKNDSGKITIQFASLTDLDNVCDILSQYKVKR